MANSEMQEYILKPGNKHYAVVDGKSHMYHGDQPDNNRVMLNETQAYAFRDKFVSQKEMKEKEAAQKEILRLQQQQNKLKEALAEKGISLDDLLSGNVTIKKPDPTPSVGTAEPAPEGTVPAPVGSTPDPVNQPPKAVDDKENKEKPAAPQMAPVSTGQQAKK